MSTSTLEKQMVSSPPAAPAVTNVGVSMQSVVGATTPTAPTGQMAPPPSSVSPDNIMNNLGGGGGSASLTVRLIMQGKVRIAFLFAAFPDFRIA